VVTVDINPQAVEAARRNVIRNGVADRVDVRHSDVFGAVDGAFDVPTFITERFAEAVRAGALF
jgi:release factor glutamine methyltransferase